MNGARVDIFFVGEIYKLLEIINKIIFMILAVLNAFSFIYKTNFLNFDLFIKRSSVNIFLKGFSEFFCPDRKVKIGNLSFIMLRTNRIGR